MQGTATNLSRIDDLKLCSGINAEIVIGTLFNLSIAAADKIKLEELMMLENISFYKNNWWLI